MVGDVLPAPPQPERICNLDNIDLIKRIDRLNEEMNKSASATKAGTSAHDRARFSALLADLKRNVELYGTNADLDLPKYHPTKTAVPAPPELKEVENLNIMAFIRIMLALRVEIANWATAECASGIRAVDLPKITAVVARLEAVVAAMENDDTIDTPNAIDQKPGE